MVEPERGGNAGPAGEAGSLGSPVSPRSSGLPGVEAIMGDTVVEADELLGQNPLPDYNEDERRYSVYVRETLLQLLRGNRDELDLLAKYHREPDRLGAMPLPKTVDARKLRLPRVEKILEDAIRFLHDGSSGGPIAQSEDRARGLILQRRDFPTRFPHIVLERTDRFDEASGQPVDSFWCVHRLQNTRRNVRINRVLDLLNLGVELFRLGG